MNDRPTASQGATGGSAARLLILLGSLWLLTVVAFTARVVLFRIGYLFGDSQALLLDLVAAGLLAAAGTFTLSYFLRRRDPDSKLSTEIGASSAAFAIAAAAVALTQLVIPNTPRNAAAQSCRGVPVEGAPFLAQTVAIGVNAHSGASDGFSESDRFGGDCTLGFSGYCIGQPIANTLTQVYDTRWLIVYHRDEVVSAAEIRPQSPTAALGQHPSPSCARYHGLSEPGAIHFRAVREAHNVVGLSVTDTNAALIGYAVRVDSQLGGGYPYSEVGSGPLATAPHFSGIYKAATALSGLQGGDGTVELAADACLAGDVPIGSPSVYRIVFHAGRVVHVQPSRPESLVDSTQLGHVACSGP